MNLAVVVAAVAGGAAAALLGGWPRRSEQRVVTAVRRGRALQAGSSVPREPGPVVQSAGPSHGRTWTAGLLAGLAAALLIPSPAGVVVGFPVALLLPVALRRLEPAAARRRRLAMLRAAPLVAELLGAALGAGVALERALPVVARAVGGPTEEALLMVDARIRLGESAAAAWLRLSDAPGLCGVARCVARSSRTGAPLAALLVMAAQELREESLAASLAEVRAVSVRSVLPLGLCLLPAFVLLGIVPVVAGMLPRL